MPVTLNPPPFPTPDNATSVASDKAQESHAAPHDAFAALLLAAGDPAGGALPSDPNDPAGADPLRALRAALNGGRDKLPIVSLPVLGRDAALVGQAGKPDASTDAAAIHKTEDDKPGADILAASDLAGMTAALNALLAAGTSSATAVASTAAADSQAKAGAGSDAISTTADAATARRDALQADLRAAADARADAPAATSPALQVMATAGHEPTTQTKTAPVASGAVDASGVQSQVAALQHNLSAATAPQITIATPVTSPAWQHEFADKLGQVVMTGADRAEFRVHPADMGPVNVSISVSADQASVVITAAHATTRDALEQALPQLRDLLANQGITLGQASVQSENRPKEESTPSRDLTSPLDDSGSVETPLRRVRLNGLVDVFA